MLSTGNTAQRLRPRSTAAPGPLLRHPGGSTSTLLHVGVAPSRRWHQGLRPRSLPGFEVATPTASAAYHVASPRAEARPPSASSNGAASSSGGSGGGSSNPSSSFGSGSLNGAGSPPADRSTASTSELLRAVLKRRAERLQRQQEAGQAPPPPPAAPPHPQEPPPRYQPAWANPPPSPGPNGASPLTVPPPVNGTASYLNGAATSLGGGPAYSPPPLQAAAPVPPLGLQPAPLPDARLVRQNAAELAREDAVAQRRLATVRFWLKFRAEWGQRLKVVGTHQELGAWVLSQAPELKWSQGDNWHVTVQLPAGGVVEYKYVLLDHSGHHPVAWQQGNNSVLALRPSDELVEVFDNWGADPGAKLVADGGQPVTREHRLLSWASEMEAQLVSQKQDLRRSRMELAAAQEEARDARLEAQRFKAQLRAMEAEKAEAAAHLQQARALNAALQTQLADTTASFQDALRTAADILSQIDDTAASPVRALPPSSPPSAPPAALWPAAAAPAPKVETPSPALERRDERRGWSGGESRRREDVQAGAGRDLSSVPDFFASGSSPANGRAAEEQADARQRAAAAEEEEEAETGMEAGRQEEQQQQPSEQPGEEYGSATSGYFSSWLDPAPPAATEGETATGREEGPAASQQPDYSSVPDFWGSSAPSSPRAPEGAAAAATTAATEPDYSSVPDFWGSSAPSQPAQPAAQGGYARRSQPSAVADRRSPGVMVAAAAHDEGEASDGERTDSSDDEAPAEAEAQLAAAASGARGFAPRDAACGAAAKRRRRPSKGAKAKARSRK